MIVDAVFFRGRDGKWCARVGDGPVIKSETCSAMLDAISAPVFDALRKPKADPSVPVGGPHATTSGR